MTTQALKAVATGAEPPARLSDMKPKEQIAYLLKTKQGEIAVTAGQAAQKMINLSK